MWGIVISLGAILSITLFMFENITRKQRRSISDLTIQVKQENQNREHTEQKRKNLQQQYERIQLHAIIPSQTENAIMLMNASGDILWTNASFTRMYEYTYTEFTTTVGNNIRRTSFNPEIHERLNNCIQQKKAITYEALNITKSGKEIWTQTSLIPMLGDKNEVVGLVTIDSDIHQRIIAGVALEKHLQEFNRKTEKISDQLHLMTALTDALFERIEKSQHHIDKTNQIINYIKEISDQTKILGINASIEAHAAGESGKGFRVIASEIVNISNITLKSMKEIKELIISVKKTSEKLGNEKERSEQAISDHQQLINDLKKEINEVECVAYQMK